MNLAFWRKQYETRRRWVLAAAVVLAVLLLSSVFRSPDKQADAAPMPTFEVLRGPLTISFSQSGTIRAMQQEVIASEVEGQTTIIFLVEEGIRVSKGDLLVELDASSLEDKLVEQQIQVQNAEAAFIRARENLAVVKNQAESDIALAELNFRFAQEDLKKYVEGQYKQELMEAESSITLAEEELQLATRKLEWSEKLFGEDYVSQTERDGDRLSYNRAKLDLELAQAAKQLLEDYTYTRQLAQLESDVDQTKRALERTQLKTSADIVQADADLKAKEAALGQQQGKEQKIREQIAKTRMVAPREGLVVYATSGRGGWRGNDEPLEEGQTVRERQEIIHLPTADEMMAVVEIHESNLDRVRIGQPVAVTLDALQGRTFMGKVSRIAPLPDAQSIWMNPDLTVYRTEIEILGRQPELRTGMSCRAEIIVDQYEEATYVPVQAVLRIAGKPTVFVRRFGKFRPTPVEVGLDNNRMVHILSGLKPGQTVLLTPPLEEASTPEDQGPGNGRIDADKLKAALKDAQEQPAAVPSDAAPGAGEEKQEGPAPMTPEQREEMRRRFESMTPEQQKEMKKRFGRGRPRSGAGGGSESGP